MIEIRTEGNLTPTITKDRLKLTNKSTELTLDDLSVSELLNNCLEAYGAHMGEEALIELINDCSMIELATAAKVIQEE